MTLLIAIVLIIGFAGIIGNQYSGLQRMGRMQETLDEIRDALREKNGKETPNLKKSTMHDPAD